MTAHRMDRDLSSMLSKRMFQLKALAELYVSDQPPMHTSISRTKRGLFGSMFKKPKKPFEFSASDVSAFIAAAQNEDARAQGKSDSKARSSRRDAA